ncbi:PTS sugar transporter subunit IIA [Enterococcus sp. AZ135]|uniref:PTS sugar transporter subunit IIA n=1 Tax=Enterococcus sp. AZ135 TaxID=2774631 RepID=UPI003F6894C8
MKRVLNLFRKEQIDRISSPCQGKLITIEEVNDKMFSEKLLGDGFAIEPDDDVVRAPCSGKISLIANTLHAFGITTNSGAEILVHVGLNTVELNGKGFAALVPVGKKVTTGTSILKLDLFTIKEQKSDLDLTIPVVLTNSEEFKLDHHLTQGNVTHGDEIAVVHKLRG